ncbi:nuclear pore complex protein Nup54-like [Galendromus occidentalis]|uniref:Nuclear pore complex protein Nup54-like n=1 Tax=Galendromus occidentalis TaxID=34638 RepID=A0AAJ6QS49_9ACAR|nr:nuclear pore complex protein Nup54-like [Galendromus occidentalis]
MSNIMSVQMSGGVDEALDQQDHRVRIVAMLRLLQAKFGIASPADLQRSEATTRAAGDPSYVFRTFAYNALPSHRADDGLVCLLISKDIKEIRSMVPTITELLHRNVIKSDSLSIFVDSMNDLGSYQTRIIVYVKERIAGGKQRRWGSRELKEAFDDPKCKAALTDMGVVDLAEVVELAQRQVEQYLANPPPGVSAESWELAKSDNPDRTKLVPVPVIGFESLDTRFELQLQYQERLKAKLASMSEEIDRLEERFRLAKARIDQFNLNQHQIAHRILGVMGVFERCRMRGTEKKPYESFLEDSLKNLLEEIHDLSKGRFREVQDMILQSTLEDENAQEDFGINSENLPRIRDLFQEHQKGLAALIDILKEDLKAMDNLDRAVREIRSKQP